MRRMSVVLLLAACGEQALPDLVLNEVVARALDDGNDAVELLNTGEDVIDLTEFLVQGRLLNGELDAGEYLVVDLTGLGSSDSVELTWGHDVVATTSWSAGQAADGTSWARVPDGTGDFETVQPTLGKKNKGGGIGFDCEDLGYQSGTIHCTGCGGVSPANCEPYPSDVVINEVLSSDDVFEVYNAGTTSVMLSSLTVVDRYFPTEERALRLTGILDPGAFAWFAANVENEGFKLDPDEHLTLRDAEGRALDFVEWEGGAETACRMPDGGPWTPECLESMGATNLQ